MQIIKYSFKINYNKKNIEKGSKKHKFKFNINSNLSVCQYLKRELYFTKFNLKFLIKT